MPPKKKAKTTTTQPPKKKAKGKNTAQPRKKEEAQSREPFLSGYLGEIPNGAITKHFRELEHLYKLKGDIGRASAFDEFAQFADDPEHYCGDVKITSVKHVQKLLVERPYIQESGWRIGKSTFEEIDEFFKSGTSKRLEELRPSTLVAKVSANTYLLKMLHEKGITEEYYRANAYSNACCAIKRCEHDITSGKEAMKLKGFDKLSAELIDIFFFIDNFYLKEFHRMASAENPKAYSDACFAIKESSAISIDYMYAYEKSLKGQEKLVEENFFDIVKSKGVRETVASLPKDAEITLDGDGVLRVNGNIKEDFHARGCPFELTLNGKTWVVDGSMKYYDGNRDWCGEFEGTLTHKKEVISINYTSGSRDFHDQYFETTLDEDEHEVVREALEDKVFSLYKWNHVKE